ncbi:hypothetical protein TCAL_08729 [Tigriopus californicus]|uniref:G-protein coupled receptors family 1 profile domain-containing protein n=1 Tax=Tigriopus californicus TaxID=6832 RepID=A0A553P7I2_TIGCA|nr:FMRFamide receptor-like [Tigriopus californicus]TRY73600.1 hypothetical protein TCAL_08729 [Tigriopus californicus]|eukprot:TCALIF_08729-PA protein Name:"Similar to FR FMRFamide receptor (Drosophila melanogaster)" AED:0.18 eAED:0.25 QI:0/-1/0/1/-1/1/1/0/532
MASPEIHWPNQSSLHDSINEEGQSPSRSGSDREELITFVVEGVILTIVSSVGLVGNFMSIFVLIQVKNVQKAFSNLLLGLACFDTLFLWVAILAFGLPNLSNWYKETVFLPIMAITFGLLHTFRVGSVFVTLSVNFERFYAIVFPLKHFGCKRYLLPASILLTVVYNIPKFFEMELHQDKETNMSSIQTTELRRNPMYMSLYVFWSKFIFIEIIPYIIIMICNTFIIFKITKSARFRNSFKHKDTPETSILLITRRGRPRLRKTPTMMSESSSQQPFRRQKEEHNLGIILISMSTLFIICQSLKIIPDLYELIWCNQDPDTEECHFNTLTSGIIRISHLLVCFNSAANFVVYYVSGRKFRKAWLDLYGPCFGRRRSRGMPIEIPATSAHTGDVPTMLRKNFHRNHQRFADSVTSTFGKDGYEAETGLLRRSPLQLQSTPPNRRSSIEALRDFLIKPVKQRSCLNGPTGFALAQWNNHSGSNVTSCTDVVEPNGNPNTKPKQSQPPPKRPDRSFSTNNVAEPNLRIEENPLFD